MANTRLSPGVYRDASGRLILVPPKNISRDTRGGNNPKTGNNSKKETQVKGRQVSYRQSGSDAVCIYGTTRLGGVYTYLDTGDKFRAFLRIGEENSQIVWIAKEAGSEGNSISITLELGPTNATTVTVLEKAITIGMKFSSGQSRSRATDVIAAVKASAAASALVTCHAGEGDGTGYVEPALPQLLQEGGGGRLHHYVTIAGHEITAIDKLYLDDREVTFGATSDPRWAIGLFAKYVFMAKQLGKVNQASQPELMAQVGEDRWGENHRQQNCAGAYIVTKWAAGLFPNGVPDVEFLVRGKKCYDFRNQSTGFTANAALVLADFLCDSRFGPGIKRQYLNAENWSTAADICDEQVKTPAGVFQNRYEINGFFDTGTSIKNIIDQMLQAMGGDLVYQSGEWFCYPAKWREPTWAITEGDFLSEPRVTTSAPRRQRFNAVRGKFMDREKKYVETDYPAITNSYYAEIDGQVIFEDIPQPFITHRFQARRVARIELERVRQGIEVDVQMGPEALQLAICDTLTLSYPRLGWVEKLFEVRDIQIGDLVEGGLRVQVKLRETASQIFNWSINETKIDYAPDTRLPDPYFAKPVSNIVLASGTEELYIRNDGTVFPRLKVSWTPPEDEFVTEGGQYNIQFRKIGGAWLYASSVDGDQASTYILDVQDNAVYDVRVQAQNTLNVKSYWVEKTGHLVLGKTVPPTTPTQFEAKVFDGGIYFGWSKVPDLDVNEYELRLGSSWESATLLSRVAATTFVTSRRAAGSYTALLKAIDTSGNYSITAASAAFSVPTPSAPVVTYKIEAENAVLGWTESQGVFPIDSYIVKMGETLESATTLAQVKALNFATRAAWIGGRNFWIQAVDVAGNVGAAGFVTVVIQAPNAPAGFTAEVIDNNVLLRWAEPAVSSLPIAQYELRRGDNFATATPIGSTLSTFSTRFEMQSGTFTYHAVTVDSAGNTSAPAATTANVDEPPDFEFFGSHDFAFDDSSTSAAGPAVLLQDASVLTSSSVLLPTSHETWTDHFALHGWDTLAEQLADDYPYLVHPTDSTASVQLTHDFGAAISSTTVSVAYLKTDLSGAVTITPTISTSANGTSWTNHGAGITRVFATGLRYVRVTLDAVGSTDKGLAILSNVAISLSVKEATVSGSGQTDSSGATLGRKTVSIAGEFSDVQSIIVAPGFNAAFGVVAVYDFVDTANPTEFTVYTYRADTGAVVGGIAFSYTLRGYSA